jgi:hypothetical protein
MANNDNHGQPVPLTKAQVDAECSARATRCLEMLVAPDERMFFEQAWQRWKGEMQMGILLIPKAQPEPAPLGRPVTIAHRGGQQIAVEMPSPASRDYVRERERMDHWRGTVSQLGGTSNSPWGYKPAGLKPEFRPKAWSGSVPWQQVPRDMSQHQWKRGGRS